MIALLSDVHANLEALQAVLADLARHGAEAVYCLGDVVGYGPDPRACLDLAMTWRAVLLGNHDEAALLGPDGFTPAAARAALWTQDQLAAEPCQRTRGRRLDFLAGLPRRHVEGGFLFVHGSARDPLNEYVYPEDVHDQGKMGRIFAQVGRCCFQGHTHVPGVFTEGGPAVPCRFRSPEELGHRYRLGGGKALVNVGSVGQPRDGDWRASYALLEGDTVHFRRVEYDVEATVRKVRDSGGLGPRLGERLRQGR
jgi:diadenosine tetraphosphatase ApaH/serine/threonine PP2A family protein phosphatase